MLALNMLGNVKLNATAMNTVKFQLIVAVHARLIFVPNAQMPHQSLLFLQRQVTELQELLAEAQTDTPPAPAEGADPVVTVDTDRVARKIGSMDTAFSTIFTPHHGVAGLSVRTTDSEIGIETRTGGIQNFTAYTLDSMGSEAR